MILSLLLQAETGVGGSQYSGIIMIVLLFVIMYFFMIRPQQKQRKEIEKQRAALKVGDKIVTSGGMYGKIKEVNDTTFLVEIADGIKVKVDKTSVFAATDGNQTRQ